MYFPIGRTAFYDSVGLDEISNGKMRVARLHISRNVLLLFQTSNGIQMYEVGFVRCSGTGIIIGWGFFKIK